MLLLDVKGAYDHVSSKQLLRVMRKLGIPSQILDWTKLFLENRKISLAFDGEKEEPNSIRTGIPQGSPISPILFLIYMRFLFQETKTQFPTLRIPSYVDDIAIIAKGTIQENCQILERACTLFFSWAKENEVAF